MSKPTPVDPEALPYRPCVGQMVFNRDGLVWIGCRPGALSDAEGMGSWWQMPQGGIDPGEDPKIAALRELREETAMTTVELMAECPDWLTYDLPPELLGKAWGGRYRGQKQRWFAYRFLGPDSEINITPSDPRMIEFVDWRWSPITDVAATIVPFKRAVYEQVIAAFSPLATPL